MPKPPPTPTTAWALVNERDIPLRQAAVQLSIDIPELLTLLAAYEPPAPEPPAPPANEAAAPPGPRPRRIDILEAWRLAEQGASPEQIAARMGFSADGIKNALAREARRRGCPPPTETAPRLPTAAEIAWDMVHGDGLDVRTVGRRLALRPPDVLALLATQAPTVREREWQDLQLAGAAPEGKADWAARRDAHLRSRVSAFVAEGLTHEVIRERLGLTASALTRLIDEVRHRP